MGGGKSPQQMTILSRRVLAALNLCVGRRREMHRFLRLLYSLDRSIRVQCHLLGKTVKTWGRTYLLLSSVV